MMIVKFIPNILTSIRIGLTLLYLHLLYALNRGHRSYFTAALVVFILICLTDFFDGKIARAARTASYLGAILDVAADFVFIISALIVLSVNNIIPMWFIALVLGKFTEFLTTSYFIKKYENSSNSLFIFDYFGRIAAVNFFLIPGISLFMYVGLSTWYINTFAYFTLILVVISSSARIIRCCKIQRLKLLIRRENSTTYNEDL